MITVWTQERERARKETKQLKGKVNRAKNKQHMKMSKGMVLNQFIG
jgi:ABC-type enterochelin transport system substrate-binding protein